MLKSLTLVAVEASSSWAALHAQQSQFWVLNAAVLGIYEDYAPCATKAEVVNCLTSELPYGGGIDEVRLHGQSRTS